MRRLLWLVLLLFTLNCLTVSSQVDPLLAGHACLQWDSIESVLEIDGFWVEWSVNQVQQAPFNLSAVEQLESCCNDPVPPDCLCRTLWQPESFSPIAKFPDVAPGSTVCVTVAAYRLTTIGNRSNPVCFEWPQVCNFTTRQELEACYAVPS